MAKMRRYRIRPVIDGGRRWIVEEPGLSGWKCAFHTLIGYDYLCKKTFPTVDAAQRAIMDRWVLETQDAAHLRQASRVVQV